MTRTNLTGCALHFNIGFVSQRRFGSFGEDSPGAGLSTPPAFGVGSREPS